MNTFREIKPYTLKPETDTHRILPVLQIVLGGLLGRFSIWVGVSEGHDLPARRCLLQHDFIQKSVR